MNNDGEIKTTEYHDIVIVSGDGTKKLILDLKDKLEVSGNLEYDEAAKIFLDVINRNFFDLVHNFRGKVIKLIEENDWNDTSKEEIENLKQKIMELK